MLAAGAAAEVPLRSALLQAAAGNLAAADRDFHTARDLRPWDGGGIAQIAAHAYAVLAGERIAGAAGLGLPWAAEELAAYPDSVQALAGRRRARDGRRPAGRGRRACSRQRRPTSRARQPLRAVSRGQPRR